MMGRGFRYRLAGVSLASAALLVVSCGTASGSPDATQTTAPAASDVALVDLDPAAVAGWTTVNDPVMGGASTSTVAAGDGGLVFSGNVSLANNGGFASARSPEDPGIGQRATGATALRMRAEGDGKVYLLKLGVAGQPWSYVQRFRTVAGTVRTYELPVEDFEPVGMRLDPAPDAPRRLDPATIDQLSVYILDGQQGPFAITVAAIDATT